MRCVNLSRILAQSIVLQSAGMKVRHSQEAIERLKRYGMRLCPDTGKIVPVEKGVSYVRKTAK